MTTIIEQDGYFTSLPREYYVSHGIYEREVQKILHRQWLLVGHVSFVKRVGDFFVAQAGPESLIITRDKNERLRAYFNVCRHRGYQLCEPGQSGNAKRITCPYHAWTYDCDGSLFAVPGAKNGSDFRFQDWSLHEAWCDVKYGFIYVNLGRETPRPLAESIFLPDGADAAIRAVNPERMKLAHRETYLFNANWKVVMENENECYHCGVAHAALIQTCDYQAFYADTRTQAHFPLRKGMKTFSMDGEWVCARLLGDQPQAAGFSTGYLQAPLFGGPLFFADHAVVMQLTPLSQDKTQLVCEWFVHEDAVEGVDYDPKKVMEVFHRTNLEDAKLSERTQRGVQSTRFVPGPNNERREDGLKITLTKYLEMMNEP